MVVLPSHDNLQNLVELSECGLALKDKGPRLTVGLCPSL